MVVFRFVAIILGIVLTALIAEVALRVLVLQERHFAVWPSNARRIFHPFPGLLPGIHGPARFTVNSRGIRGKDVDPVEGRDYRILALGGSTTECAYLDDAETWTSLLQEILGRTSDGREVWVGNAGRAGMNSRDHVLHVKYLTAQPPRMDMVLLLVGVNDLTVRLAQGDQYVPSQPLTDPEAERAQIQRAFLVVPGRLQDAPVPSDAAWFSRTATYQLLRRAGRVVRSRLADRGLLQDEAGDTLQRYREHRKSAARMINRLPDLTMALAEYRWNLNAIVDLARERGLRLVLMTQPSVWRRDLPPRVEDLLWLGGVGEFQREKGKPYYTVSVLSEGMRLYNETLLDICETRQVECLDLAARAGRDEDLFYDDVHFTERGARVVAETIAQYLRKLAPFS